MDRFILRRNIHGFRRQLSEARNVAERERLARLLAEVEEQLRRSDAAHADKPHSEPHLATPGDGDDAAAARGRISKMVEKLQIEPDASRRRSLSRRLIEEEDRFGALSRRIDLADAYIEDGARRVAALELLVAGLSRDDESRRRHLSNLATSREILDIFKRYRSGLADRAKRIDI